MHSGFSNYTWGRERLPPDSIGPYKANKTQFSNFREHSNILNLWHCYGYSNEHRIVAGCLSYPIPLIPIPQPSHNPHNVQDRWDQPFILPRPPDLGLLVFHFSLLELQVEVCDAFKEAGPHSLQNAYVLQVMRPPSEDTPTQPRVPFQE